MCVCGEIETEEGVCGLGEGEGELILWARWEGTRVRVRVRVRRRDWFACIGSTVPE